MTRRQEAVLVRELMAATHTAGRLYVGGALQCDTLEPPDALLTAGQDTVEAIRAAKDRGLRAIPAGTYGLTLAVKSPSFADRAPYGVIGGCMPRLLDVPGFERILIHPLNVPTETRGCIGVGTRAGEDGGRLVGSRDAFWRLYGVLRKLGVERLRVERHG